MRRFLIAFIILSFIVAQSIQAQKIVLHLEGNRKAEYSVEQLDSITFEEDDIKGHEWVDLGLPSGTLWATCNVGANTPEEFGDYFAWGETKPKEIYSWATYIHCNGSENTITKYCTDSKNGYNGITDNIKDLLPEDDAATVNWGSGWQIPSDVQRDELIHYTTHTWITQNGVMGMIFTSTINGKRVFFPAAGVRNNSSLDDESTYGHYWTRTLGHGVDPKARRMYFNSTQLDTGGNYRYRFYGESIRPVRVQKSVLVNNKY